MKKLTTIGMILITVLLFLNTGCNKPKSRKSSIPVNITLSNDLLRDKIKGGWAGQTLGVTYGGPTEFRYMARFIPDSILIAWPDTGYCKWWFDNHPGLYDDLYMDLTFVQVFEKDGINAPVDSFAKAFANAPYPLWHGNQAARYNILNGIMPPKSGYWKNNPHSDDIDYQIESDYAGLMTPGMPIAASKIADKVGHIMGYGDGWYGGVYVSSMYSLAFISSDINYIVKAALEMIPQESEFYQCMNDVIGWISQNEDWRQTWTELEKKWGNDITCPDGYSSPFNIEAKMNCAYVIMGLLYGNGDMGKTLEVSARCGADSDCNPSTAAGILGTMLGYSNIPAKWLNNVKEVEDRIFPYTKLSLKDTYGLSFKHALEMIQLNGGKVNKSNVAIAYQNPSPVRFEKSFDGIAPVKKETIGQPLTANGFEYKFEGNGILISGQFDNQNNVITQGASAYVGVIEVIIDGKHIDTVKFPADFHDRKLEIYWNFDLSSGNHKIELILKNPDQKDIINLNYAIVYAKK